MEKKTAPFKLQLRFKNRMINCCISNIKLHNPNWVMWLFCYLLLQSTLYFSSCSKEVGNTKASLILKTNSTYTQNGVFIPVGGPIKIGVLASGAGSPLTYIRIERITLYDTITELDRGIFIGSEGLDVDYTFSKDTAQLEHWRIIVMNADRDTAMRTLDVFKGTGSAYGPISYFESIKIGYQGNSQFGQFLDIETGIIHDDNSVSGHESEIDLLAYYYITSGLSSPTFTCPGYTAAIGYYPELASWSIKNTTLYDYKTSDNGLITPNQFDSAINDSLLVSAYMPDKVSGNCKYCYTGRVIPFKTQTGKYGLVKVLHAEEKEDGMIEIAVKVQK